MAAAEMRSSSPCILSISDSHSRLIGHGSLIVHQATSRTHMQRVWFVVACTDYCFALLTSQSYNVLSVVRLTLDLFKASSFQSREVRKQHSGDTNARNGGGAKSVACSRRGQTSISALRVGKVLQLHDYCRGSTASSGFTSCICSNFESLRIIVRGIAITQQAFGLLKRR